MKILDQLASLLGRRDEVPNEALAKKIAAKKDKDAIRELIALLQHKSKAVKGDVIKVLYEAGAVDPSLLAPYLKEFISLLKDKDNRMQWGAMMAINCIANEKPKEVHKNISQIMEAAEKGSVITKDATVNILVKLAAIQAYRENAVTLLLEILKEAPENQFPTYAEKTFPFIDLATSPIYSSILHLRLKDLKTPTKIKRVEKLIQQLKNTG